MNAFSWTNSHLWQLAGWTLWHTLWIGVVIGGVALATRPLVTRANSQVRYFIALGWFALLAVSPLPIGYWVWETGHGLESAGYGNAGEADGVDVSGSGRNGEVPVVDVFSNETQPFVFENAKPALDEGPGNTLTSPAQETVMFDEGDHDSKPFALSEFGILVSYLPFLWIVGAPVTFLLLATGMVGAERLRRQSRRVDDVHVVAMLERLSKALELKVDVTIAVCDRLAGPILVGIMRPIVLLPAASLGHWSPEQFEMVLLHELSHVRRWDNLVNLLQRVVESLLFFVPTVWFVSRWVRQEREHCCDRCVVSHTGRAREYAQTLVQLAERRFAANSSGRNRLAGLFASPMAEHQLLARVRHILKHEDESMNISRTLFGSVVMGFAALVAIIGWFGTTLTGAQEPAAQPPATTEVATEPTAPAKGGTTTTVDETSNKPEAPVLPTGKTDVEAPKGPREIEPVDAIELDFIERGPGLTKGAIEKKVERKKRVASFSKKGRRKVDEKAQLVSPEIGARITYLDDVTVTSNRAGILESIKVQLGDVVKQGDELATFSSDALQQAKLDVQIADVKRQSARKDFERAKQLYERQAMSTPEMQKFQLASELAELEAQREELKFASMAKPLTAPMNGTVMEVFKRAGWAVEPGNPVVRLANTDRFAIEGDIDIQQGVIPKKGQEFALMIINYSVSDSTWANYPVHGKVDFVSSELVGNQHLKFRGTIENQDGTLRAGMVARVVIIDGEGEAGSSNEDSASQDQTKSNKDAAQARLNGLFGMNGVTELTSTDAVLAKSNYRGGILLDKVDPQGPAGIAGITDGDILVGLGKWETKTLDDFLWALRNPENRPWGPIRFYILRGGKTHRGGLEAYRDYAESDAWSDWLSTRPDSHAQPPASEEHK